MKAWLSLPLPPLNNAWHLVGTLKKCLLIDAPPTPVFTISATGSSPPPVAQAQLIKVISDSSLLCILHIQFIIKSYQQVLKTNLTSSHHLPHVTLVQAILLPRLKSLSWPSRLHLLLPILISCDHVNKSPQTQ